MSALFHDASLIRGENKLHRYQKDVINNFIVGEQNRFVLTAPTSFGKTFLVYQIIQKMHYQNILLIFPSISLLSENYTRLYDSDAFKEYKIHSLSEEEFDPSEKNIFIFTPERYLSFMDRHFDLRFDFSFIDEVYKIDNSFVIDQETTGENERDIAYRLALEFVCNLSKDMLLAGPYMTLPDITTHNTKSFVNFASENGFHFLQYNDFEIVSKDYQTIKGKRHYTISNNTVEIGTAGKADKALKIVEAIGTPAENVIIYCGSRAKTESYAKQLLSHQALISSFQQKCADVTPLIFTAFIEHLEETFGDDWIVVKALKGRVGIHHSLIPKYIQKEIINLFNYGALICLFSTTTITEGVNTTAKNVIITSGKKGTKPLKQFDAKNIAGRAGRFQQHYSGRVIDLDNGFEEIVNGQQEALEHKNYDVQSTKTDVDYQITKEQYLSENDLRERDSIQAQIVESGLPLEVFNCFRIVGPKDKLALYANISRLPWWHVDEIKRLSIDLARSNAHNLNWNGFQIIMDNIFQIVQEEKLKRLIYQRTGTQQKYSLVTVLLHSYLSGGFLSMIEYYVTRSDSPKTKDEAVRTVADFVYNVFKYNLVKYLGLFDVFFRYHVSINEHIEMENVAGLGILLQKLEYNALTPVARKISDYGAPFKLVDCYDSKAPYDKSSFDAYENHIDAQILKLFL